MKAGFEEVSNESKAKILFCNNIKSKKVKVGLIFLCTGLIGLKIFTTVLTFDWLADLVKSI